MTPAELTTDEPTTTRTTDGYDVVVIGGGAAGLGGALMLARSRRSVLVVDAGEPRNAPAQGVHGLLGHDGISPAELLRRGREEVTRYGGTLVDATVLAAERRPGGGFTVTTSAGAPVTARRLLVATGLADELPSVPGLRERWGRDVLHCPYCHGWEVRDTAVGVLATGPAAMHQTLLFRRLTADVTLFLHTAAAPTAEQAEQLAALGVRVVHGEVTGVVVEDDRLTGVRLRDGHVEPVAALVVAPRMVARAAFLASVGLTPVPHVSGMGDHVPADEWGRTSEAGISVAGNVTDLAAQVGAAAAAGALAGARINAELVEEDTAAAVARHRRAS